MRDRSILEGYLTLLKYDKDGKCIDETRLHNLIVDTGLEYNAKLLIGVSTDTFKYIAIGSDNTAATTSPIGSSANLSQRS